MIAEEPIVTRMVADPHDADLGAEARTAGDGVEGTPALGKFQAEEIREVLKAPRNQAPRDSVAQERLDPKPLRVLSQLLPLSLAGQAKLVFVNVHLDGRQAPSPSLQASEPFLRPEPGVFVEGPHDSASWVLRDKAQPREFIDAGSDRGVPDTLRVHPPLDLGETDGARVVGCGLPEEEFHLVKGPEEGRRTTHGLREGDGGHVCQYTNMYVYLFVPCGLQFPRRRYFLGAWTVSCPPMYGRRAVGIVTLPSACW